MLIEKNSEPTKIEISLTDISYLEEVLELLDKEKEKHPNIVVSIRVSKD